MSDAQSRYRFGPLERRGVVMGLRPGQIATLAIGGVSLMVVIANWRSVTAAIAGVGVLALSAVIAWVPVAGRTLEEWTPVVARWATRRSTGATSFRSVEPLVGQATRIEDRDGTPPPALHAVRFLSAPVPGGAVGVLKDTRRGTYTAALATAARSYVLQDEAQKARLIDGWGRVLRTLARESGAVARVQWIERTVPDDADGMGRYMRENVIQDRESAAVESYLRLVSEAAPATQAHEAYVVVQIDGRRAARAIRQAGGGDTGACAVLARELRSLQAQLASIDVAVEGALPVRRLAQVIRTAFDPDARGQLARRTLGRPELDGVAPQNAWPLACEAEWGLYHTDGTWHRTYWVAELPRVDVGTDWLLPLLLRCPARRTVSVTLKPIPPLQARRDVEATRISDLSDDALRERGGFRTTERKKREADNAERRERELVDGFADYRFSLYITVSSRSRDGLEGACGEVEQAAHECGMELRALDGEQDIAFTFTLPLAWGVR